MARNLYTCGMVAVAGLALGSQALATDMLAGTVDPTTIATSDRAYTSGANVAVNRIQRFSVSGDLPWAVSGLSFHGHGADVNLYVIDAWGPGASDAVNILWSFEGYNAGSTAQWHDFLVSGLTLDTGEYGLVITSGDATGAFWTRVSKSAEGNINMESRGGASYNTTGGTTVTTLGYSNLTGSSEILGMRVEGVLVPTPSAALVLALGGLAAARRRR